jgi:hypothetical protein
MGVKDKALSGGKWSGFPKEEKRSNAIKRFAPKSELDKSKRKGLKK